MTCGCSAAAQGTTGRRRGLGRLDETEDETEWEWEAFSGPAIPESAFTCSAAELARVQAVLGRTATGAELRRAVQSAVQQARREAGVASRALRAPTRSAATTTTFRGVLNVPPTFVPDWRPPSGATWRDLGDLVAIRLDNAAKVLSGSYMHFFCWGSAAHCPECTQAPTQYRACSSYQGRRHICLGSPWWSWYRNGQTGFMAATLLHEALHIYFRLQHHLANRTRPSVNNVYCYDTLVAALNGRTPKPCDRESCRGIPC